MRWAAAYVIQSLTGRKCLLCRSFDSKRSYSMAACSFVVCALISHGAVGFGCETTISKTGGYCRNAADLSHARQTTRGALNTQTRLGRQLESYRLLCQEFSTPPSLRHTAFIYSVFLLTIVVVGRSQKCTTQAEWWVISVCVTQMSKTPAQSLNAVN